MDKLEYKSLSRPQEHKYFIMKFHSAFIPNPLYIFFECMQNFWNLVFLMPKSPDSFYFNMHQLEQTLFCAEKMYIQILRLGSVSAV